MAHAQPCANCPHGLCPSSYDGFPELKAELFESPQEQQGALPVPGPCRSAPSSPAPRRTKQVTSGGPCRGTWNKGYCFMVKRVYSWCLSHKAAESLVH